MAAGEKVWLITGKFWHRLVGSTMRPYDRACPASADRRPNIFTLLTLVILPGTSTGFGRCLVASVLARGDAVIATVRRVEDFTLTDIDHSRLHLITLDVTELEESIRQKLDSAWDVWGRIDVLVNNAGYVTKCLIEEAGSVDHLGAS